RGIIGSQQKSSFFLNNFGKAGQRQTERCTLRTQCSL
ncbi:MAG: hypothetical protein ACI9LD_001816, partial [Polaromonas sp.]